MQQSHPIAVSVYGKKIEIGQRKDLMENNIFNLIATYWQRKQAFFTEDIKV
jgi:hypothetical protein